MLMTLHKVRFEGGAMDGKVGHQVYDPEVITWQPKQGPSEKYVPSAVRDPDGTIVYRKK